jgi:hypothetical protein
VLITAAPNASSGLAGPRPPRAAKAALGMARRASDEPKPSCARHGPQVDFIRASLHIRPVRDRRLLAAALGLSLLLHATLLLWTARGRTLHPTGVAAGVPTGKDAKDARWVDVSVEPPPARPGVTAKPNTQPVPSTFRAAASVLKRREAAPSVAQAGPAASDAPRATATRLLPSADILGPGAAPAAHGHLVVNDAHSRGNNGEQGDGKAADSNEAAAEAQARVQGLAEDMLADARVRSGQVDPNLEGLGTSLEASLGNSELSLRGTALQEMARAWLAAARADARTGNPRDEGTPAEGQPQTLTPHAFGDGSYGQGLIALLDIRLGPGGRPVTTDLVGPSGNRAFDRYVVDQAPVAIALLPTATGQAADGGMDLLHARGSHSVWEFEGKMKYAKKLRLGELHLRDVAGLAGHAVLSTLTTGYGGPTAQFDEQSGAIEAVDLANPKFSCHVRLLRLY